MFGKDASGALLLVAKHIKAIKKILDSRINGLDPRSDRKKYELDEIIWTVILMFFLREKSRNNMNILRKNSFVVGAFAVLFGIRIPHLDTCDEVLKKIEPDKLKMVLSIITAYLIQKKLFETTRYFGKVAVSFDGTGIGTIDVDESEFQVKPINDSGKSPGYVPVELFEGPEANTPAPTKKKGRIDVNVDRWATGKKSKTGVYYFTRQLILLRITGPNGLSIIVDWEPINTQDGSEKEDCEQNAAKRLLERFKTNFKRLQVIIVADGLYTNQTFIKLAEDLGFKYIFTLRDDSLKNTWKEIKAIKSSALDGFADRLIKPKIGTLTDQISIPNLRNGTSDTISREYEWIDDLSHAGFSFSWCSLNESTDNDEEFYFSVITNLSPNHTEIKSIMRLARERAIIEDGFNTLKTRGFALKHKFSRTSDFAAMNYITLMGVADILSNIVFASDWVQRTYFAADEKYSIQALINEMKVKLISFRIGKIWEILKLSLPAKTTYSRPMIS